MYERIKTPCIGICSTGIGDTVCRGCKRFAHEVIDWNSYTVDQRFIVLQRLELFLTQIIKKRLEVFDIKILYNQLKAQQIDFNESQNSFCWVYALLRAGASQIAVTEDYGFSLLPEYKGCRLQVIRDEIDREYYELSVAHYDRYIKPGITDRGCSGEK